MGAEFLPMVFTSGWASGINAYAVVLVLGLADRFFSLGQIPDALARTDVLVLAGVLFVVEMFADKIPYVDSLWDTVHTVVRPAVGATIGYLLGHETAGLDAAVGAATGGITALLSHGVKAGLRAAVNTSPEPASNVVVSTGEDVAVTGVTALAIAHPWWAASIALVLLVAGAYLVYKLLGRVRRFKRSYDAWGERVGIATPSGRLDGRPEPPPTGPTDPTDPARTPRENRRLLRGRDADGPSPRAAERLERPFDQTRDDG
jgi:hypothetical protein